MHEDDFGVVKNDIEVKSAAKKPFLGEDGEKILGFEKKKFMAISFLVGFVVLMVIIIIIVGAIAGKKNIIPTDCPLPKWKYANECTDTCPKGTKKTQLLDKSK